MTETWRLRLFYAASVGLQRLGVDFSILLELFLAYTIP